jgi:uncharacterized protein (DUF1499 family)
MTERRSWTATASELLGLLAVVAVAVGAIAGHQQWVPGFIGFRIFGIGLVLGGSLCLLFGVVGLLRTRPGSGRSGRGRAVTGTLVGAALVVLLVVLAAPGRNLPAINDISTDLDNPPEFEAARDHAANRGRDLAYPGESFAAQQRQGYPDLGPLRRDASPRESYQAVLAAAEKLGWNVVAKDPTGLTLEAFEETSFFHFVDDVVIRVRPDPESGGSIVDVRSKSRDGKGDLGANAARIRKLFAELD